MAQSMVGNISGWGRYPVLECCVYRPEKRREVDTIVRMAAETDIIPRGLGRSYGDAATNGGGAVLVGSRLNRMLSFDPVTGILECEAGVSLAEILDAFVPQGYFPSVLPGTKFVTVGGAIGNDIHGKNHHKDGTFGMFVEDFRLLTASGEVLTCSRTENGDVFWATLGGIGLTGVILTARIRLRRIETAYVSVDFLRTRNLEDALAAILESDERYTYSVGWVDCLAKGGSLGRCVLMRGNHASVDVLPSRMAREPLRLKPKWQKSIPFDFPGIVLNPLSIAAFNNFYYAVHPDVTGKLMSFDDYFCPLDSIANWNRMYGKRGFGQYQVTVPLNDSKGLVALLERVSQSHCASFLAVLKRLGPVNDACLSYPSDGFTFTMDIPMRSDLVSLLHELDRLVVEHGGRLYCAKDATAQPETFAAMYPKLDVFRQVKAKVDPDNRFSSSMARRLGIVPERKGGVCGN